MTEDTSARLARELEGLSEESIALLRRIVTEPMDTENPGLLRAQVSAANTALNVQLRADALRLRAMREDKALSRLVSLIRERAESVPQALDLLANRSQLELSDAL